MNRVREEEAGLICIFTGNLKTCKCTQKEKGEASELLRVFFHITQ
jgi:hypothetical protein